MDTSRRIFIELTGPLLKAWGEHKKARKKIDAKNNAAARRLTGSAVVRVGYEDGFVGAIFIPKTVAKNGPTRVLGEDWPKLWKHSGYDGDGHYYKPKRNSKAAKALGKLRASCPRAPTFSDFVHDHLPGFSAQGVVGHYFVRGNALNYSGRVILALPDNKNNRFRARVVAVPAGAIPLRPSTVLALYEKTVGAA